VVVGLQSNPDFWGVGHLGPPAARSGVHDES
jgi:hypothetical protein